MGFRGAVCQDYKYIRWQFDEAFIRLDGEVEVSEKDVPKDIVRLLRETAGASFPDIMTEKHNEHTNELYLKIGLINVDGSWNITWDGNPKAS